MHYACRDHRLTIRMEKDKKEISDVCLNMKFQKAMLFMYNQHPAHSNY